MAFKSIFSVFFAALCLVSTNLAQDSYSSPAASGAHDSHSDHSGIPNNQPGAVNFDGSRSNTLPEDAIRSQPGLPEDAIRSQPGLPADAIRSQPGLPADDVRSQPELPADTSRFNVRGGSYLPPKKGYQDVPVELAKGLESPPSGEVTVTEVLTSDVFKTETNLFYNTIPVTLTEFMRSTVVQPTFEVVATPVPDRVSLQKSTVTLTNTVTVTDTVTSFQYPTAVSTAVYTVTHKGYDIQQQLITSTVVETGVYRPTIVSTKVLSEYQTSTEYRTITNTIFLDTPRKSYLAPEYAAPQRNSNPSLDNQRTIMKTQQFELDLMIKSIAQSDVASLRNTQALDLARRMTQAEAAPTNIQLGLNQQILNEQNSLLGVVRSDINRQSSVNNQNFGRGFNSYVQ